MLVLVLVLLLVLDPLAPISRRRTRTRPEEDSYGSGKAIRSLLGMHWKP